MFDRFAICEAYRVYATLFHGGQASVEYEVFARLSRIGYKPSLMASDDPQDLCFVGQHVFERLVSGESSIRPR